MRRTLFLFSVLIVACGQRQDRGGNGTHDRMEQRSMKSIESSIEELSKKFDEALMNDEKLVMKFYVKAETVRKISEELCQKIDSDINLDELISALDHYRENLALIMPLGDREWGERILEPLRVNMDDGLDDGYLKCEIKRSAYVIMDLLYRDINRGQYSFDTLCPQVILDHSTIRLGDELKGSIIIGAFSTTKNPKYFIGDLDPMTGKPVKEIDSVTVRPFHGSGIFNFKPGKVGKNKLKLIWRYKDAWDGTTRYYPFEVEYTVTN